MRLRGNSQRGAQPSRTPQPRLSRHRTHCRGTVTARTEGHGRGGAYTQNDSPQSTSSAGCSCPCAHATAAAAHSVARHHGRDIHSSSGLSPSIDRWPRHHFLRYEKGATPLRGTGAGRCSWRRRVLDGDCCCWCKQGRRAAVHHDVFVKVDPWVGGRGASGREICRGYSCCHPCHSSCKGESGMAFELV